MIQGIYAHTDGYHRQRPGAKPGSSPGEASPQGPAQRTVLVCPSTSKSSRLVCLASFAAFSCVPGCSRFSKGSTARNPPCLSKDGETRTGHPCDQGVEKCTESGHNRLPPGSPYHAVTVSRVTYCSMVTPAAAVSSWCCTPSTGDHAGWGIVEFDTAPRYMVVPSSVRVPKRK